MSARFWAQLLLMPTLVASTMLSLPAQAASWRTFVSPSGSDTNDCSLSRPCRQFGAALAATSDGGEIVVLESANYGYLAIDRSVTISTPNGIYAGISVFPVPSNPNSAAILINTPGVKVVLKGLTIVGMGGFFGVKMTDGASLTVEGCTFINLTSGKGISVTVPADVRVNGSGFFDSYYGIYTTAGSSTVISNSRFYNNYVSAIPTGDTASATTSMTVENSIVKGGNWGFVAETTQSGAASRLVVDNSEVIGTTTLGAGSYTTSGISEASISNSNLVDNKGSFGAVRAYGSGATVVVSSNVINYNSIGLNALSGGVIETAGNNTVRNNVTATVGTITAFGNI